MDVSDREVLRYLGYGAAGADGRVLEMIKTLAGELSACAKPKSAYGIWQCAVAPPYVTIGELRIRSAGLARHWEGAELAALMAATLGAEADALLRRYGVTDMEKALVADAICTAMIEAYCDEVEEELAKNERVAGLCAAPRFSPGYGDLDISYQKDILRMLDGTKRIGLALTGGMMLAPSKSVIAVIGFGRDVKHSRRKCDSCDNTSCPFRRNDA